MTEELPIPYRIAVDCRDRIRTAWIHAEPVEVREATPLLDREMQALGAELRERFADTPPGKVPGVGEARRLYRSFGIDPTRTRPSSEALLRRAIRGKPLPRVSNAVDLANLCSLRTLLPLGLYDAALIEGEVELREGVAGESYPGIRKDDVHLAGRPVLADRAGPFGNPTSDSLRTSVTPGTRALWMVIFATSGYPAAGLRGHVRTAVRLMERHAGPRTRASGGLLP
ncbi:MAG: phenylalanine--tRNA ligase beta subunit-related protein [Acidobacteriota bacterium]|jgi:DNA/RNA-binding domain of Phe-tRNA-synthetase-like protein